MVKLNVATKKIKKIPAIFLKKSDVDQILPVEDVLSHFRITCKETVQFLHSYVTHATHVTLNKSTVGKVNFEIEIYKTHVTSKAFFLS